MQRGCASVIELSPDLLWSASVAVREIRKIVPRGNPVGNENTLDEIKNVENDPGANVAL